MDENVEVSMQLDAFAHGGGMLNDTDQTIVSAEWVIWDYNKPEDGRRATACRIGFQSPDAEEPSYQYYSAANPDKFVPTEDGKALRRIGTSTRLSDTSNFYVFLKSFIEAGLPSTLIKGTDVSVFVGYGVHVLNQTVTRKFEGTEKGTQVLCITHINASPDQTAAASKKTTKAAAATSDDPALDDKAESIVMEILGEKGGKVARKELMTLALQKASAAKKSDSGFPVKSVVARIGEEGFLNNNTTWAWDANTQVLSLAD